MADTIKQRVLAELGQNNSTYLDDISSISQLFEDAIWEVASSVPRRLLLTEAIAPNDPTNIPYDSDDIEYTGCTGSPVVTDDSLILLVLRVNTDYTIVDSVITEYKYLVKPCKQIAYEDSHKALDPDSIFYATKNSPVYWLENVGGNTNLQIAPSAAGLAAGPSNQYLPNEGSGSQVFTYARQELSAGEGTEWDTIDSFIGMPAEVEPLIVKGIAYKVLEQKLSNIATQDEDPEIFGLLTAHLKGLKENIDITLKNMVKEWDGK